MADRAAHEHAEPCRTCPVCAVLRAVDDIDPAVGVHLLAAGQHLVRALRAFASTVADPADHDDHVGEDVSTDDRCGTTPGVSTPAHRARQPADVTSLRRIAVD